MTPGRDLGDFTLSTWDEELPQNTVLALAQTPDGYLWLATYEGLARFDGLRFVTFDRRTTPAFGAGNEIFALTVDPLGRLCVAGAAGVLRLSSGRFEPLLGLDKLADEAPLALAAADDGLWVATTSRLLRLDDDGGVEREWQVGRELPDSSIRALLTDPSGAAWVGFDSGELMHLVGDRIDILGESSGLPPRSVRALALGSDGELWIGTMGGGLLRKVGTEVTRFGIEDGLTDDKIRCLLFDSHGALWIGTETGGVDRYFDGRFSGLAAANGMPSDLVRSLHEDGEGGLWIGTNGGGLVALREKQFSSIDRRDGLHSDNVRAVLEDHAGALWIATDGGGLHRLWDDQLTHFGVDAGLMDSFVKAIHEDRRGRLWVGTGTGLNRFDGNGFVPYTAPEGAPIARVTVVQDDAEGTLWVGTGEGLKRLASDGTISDFAPRDVLSRLQVNDILESSRGGLWVATVAGLYRVTSSQVIAFTAAEGLASSRTFSLLEDPDGTLWIGTNRGLSRYREGVFRTVRSEHGLADDVILSVLDDGVGRLWMSSNRGVFSVSRQELTDVLEGRVQSLASTRYGRADGMGADQCNGTSQPAAWKTRDGRLLWPTVKGAAVFDPANLNHKNDLPPPVVIEQMIVDDQEVPLDSTISLAPGRGIRVEFRFTGLSLCSPELVRFRYMLAGFDRDWVDVGHRRVAQYTKIPPGKYRFRVTAAGRDRVWNEVGDAVSFEIRPSFFQTSWFPWAIGSLLVTLGWIGHRWRLVRVEEQRLKLAFLVQSRTDELAAANRELQQLSITDSLTGVANRRRLDERLDEEWKRALREDNPVSLLMIDIDFFKPYNDAYGHPRGDEVLKRVAVELQASARRASDLVARYGGEEFVILVPGMESGAAERLAEQVRRRVEDLDIPYPGSSLGGRVTVSVGVATLFPTEGGSTETLVFNADKALYEAKHTGRNRVARTPAEPCFTSPSPTEPA